MIVCKFGGTTTARKKAIGNVQELIKDEGRKVLVFSAIGRCSKKDVKLTDLLISLTKESDNKEIINKITDKFNKLLNKINLKYDIKSEIGRIINLYNKNKDVDYLISRGEFLTAFLMSKFLKVKFVPAEKIIYFNKNQINYQKIQQKLNYYLNKYKKIIVPGFYGVDENHRIKLLSRGGSDVTGAIIAKAGKFKIYENWTDVDGIKEINPMICKSKTIARLDYDTLKFLTLADAKVIHCDCAEILKGNNIILKVANILSLGKRSTVVTDEKISSNYICFFKKNEKYKVCWPGGEMLCEEGQLKDKITELYYKNKEKK